MDQEITEEIVVVNTLGLHARPAAALVQTTLQFASDVTINMNGQQVNAKSIMGLLTLAAGFGSRLTVTCRGPDAREAMAAVKGLFADGFGEEIGE